MVFVQGPDSLDIPYPSSIDYHDILLLMVQAWESSSGGPVINTPAGWNVIGTATVGGSGFFPMVAFWKRADGTETGTLNVSVTGSIGSTGDAKGGMMVNYRGCIATGTPYEGAGTNAAQSTNPTGVSVTTTGPNRTIVNLFSRIVTGIGITPAAGWTEEIEVQATNASSRIMSVAVHDKVEATATTESAEVTTAASARWGDVTLALLPR